jgi:hypothetical protein
MTDEEHNSVTSAAASVSKQLINTLPAQFLALILLNVIFVGLLLWFLDDQMTSRILLADKIVTSCMEASKHQ